MELKNKTRSSTQLNSIVLLRGIASLMVCYYHFAGTIPHFIGPSNPLKFFAPFGKYGVEIFFIISGFILPYALHKSNYQVKNYLRFLSKRIIRIEPTYIFSLVSIIFFNLICNLNPIARSTFRFQIDLNQLLFHVGYLVDLFYDGKWINPAYWTLGIEFQYYLILGLSFGLIMHPNKIVRYIFQLVFLAIFPLLIHFIPETGSIMHLFRFACLFSAGIFIFYKYEGLINWVEFATAGIILLVFIFKLRGIENVVVVIFSALVILFFNYSINRFFTFLGTISYSLYLSHFFVERIISFSTNFIKNELYQSCVLFIGLFIAILLAYLLYYLVERPSIKFAQQIKYTN